VEGRLNLPLRRVADWRAPASDLKRGGGKQRESGTPAIVAGDTDGGEVGREGEWIELNETNLHVPVASRETAGRHRPLPLRRWRRSGVVGDGGSGDDSFGKEVGRDQEDGWSSLEVGVEWNGEVVELGWWRISGDW
jgi:hypothetical protein